jgi:hypothetical protein
VRPNWDWMEQGDVGLMLKLPNLEQKVAVRARDRLFRWIFMELEGRFARCLVPSTAILLPWGVPVLRTCSLYLSTYIAEHETDRQHTYRPGAMGQQ